MPKLTPTRPHQWPLLLTLLLTLSFPPSQASCGTHGAPCCPSQPVIKGCSDSSVCLVNGTCATAAAQNTDGTWSILCPNSYTLTLAFSETTPARLYPAVFKGAYRVCSFLAGLRGGGRMVVVHDETSITELARCLSWFNATYTGPVLESRVAQGALVYVNVGPIDGPGEGVLRNRKGYSFICLTQDVTDAPAPDGVYTQGGDVDAGSPMESLAYEGGSGDFNYEDYFTSIGGFVVDEYDIESLEADGDIANVVAHEIMHILGFGSSFLWGQHLFSVTGSQTCPSNDNSTTFAGRNAVEQYQLLGGLGSPPVSEILGSSSACKHWDEEVLEFEIMSPRRSEENFLSTITIGAFEDIGYEVVYDVADNVSLDILSEGRNGSELGRLLREQVEEQLGDEMAGVSSLDPVDAGDRDGLILI